MSRTPQTRPAFRYSKELKITPKIPSKQSTSGPSSSGTCLEHPPKRAVSFCGFLASGSFLPTASRQHEGCSHTGSPQTQSAWPMPQLLPEAGLDPSHRDHALCTLPSPTGGHRGSSPRVPGPQLPPPSTSRPQLPARPRPHRHRWGKRLRSGQGMSQSGPMAATNPSAARYSFIDSDKG